MLKLLRRIWQTLLFAFLVVITYIFVSNEHYQEGKGDKHKIWYKQSSIIGYWRTRLKPKYFVSIFTVFFKKTLTTKYPITTQEDINNHLQDRNVPQQGVFDSTSSTTISTNNEDIKIAIFGACGYVGSYLTLYLSSAGFQVFPFDMNPKVPKPVCKKLHSNSIERYELQSFNTVIFLGGCTGRRSCAELDPRDIEKNNIHDAVSYTHLTLPTILLV